jgi:hypothetical protein
MPVVVRFTNREPLLVEAADSVEQDKFLFAVTARWSQRAIALFDARDVVEAQVFRDGRLAEVVIGLGEECPSDERRPRR